MCRKWLRLYYKDFKKYKNINGKLLCDREYCTVIHYVYPFLVHFDEYDYIHYRVMNDEATDDDYLYYKECYEDCELCQKRVEKCLYCDKLCYLVYFSYDHEFKKQ